MSLKISTWHEFSDRLSFTLLGATRRFPQVGPFGEDHQANIELAMASLFEALPVVQRRIKQPEAFQNIVALLEASLMAYRSGDRVTGGRLLNEINDVVAPSRYAEYEKRKGIGE